MVASFDHVNCEFIELGEEYESMAQAYNAGTEMAKGKYLVYCHQDVRLLDKQFTEKVEKTISANPGIGIIGLVGTSSNNQRSVWFAEAASSYLGEVTEFDVWMPFGPSNNVARTVDSFMMITDKRLVFPEILSGIHLLDAWMCRQVEELGYYNWVCDIQAQHLSRGNPSTQEFRDNLELYRWYWYHNEKASPRINHSKSLPELSIVIAVYNNLYCTRRLLEQLKSEAVGAEIIVVNNASTDGTRKWLNAQNDIKVIENSKNEGVSRAWNCGLNRAKGKVLAVLNNDVELLPGGISKLYSEALRCGISCATMVRSNPHMRGGVTTNHVANSDYANGEALFFKREVWLSVGEFDESYQLAYYEDTDWSCRARLKGHTWSNVDNTMHHHQGQTSRLVPEVQQHMENNRQLFMRRYNHLGFSLHYAFDCYGIMHNVVNTLKQIKQLRQEKPLSRIYVYCPQEYNIFFESKDVDYVGQPNANLDYNTYVSSKQHTHASPLVGDYTSVSMPRVVVGTLMCDRKRDSQMISLRAIEKLNYDNFDVYINIQSANPNDNFAEVYQWAKIQELKNRRVHIDVWDWNSSWSRKPEFDQDRARLAPICIARNMMLQAASSLGYDYLLQVDNDVMVPSNSIEVLLSEDRPIVGGVVPGRGVHNHLNYLFGSVEDIDSNKKVVSYTTCGFVLLRRDVFEYMRYRTGWGIHSRQVLSEDPAFFGDAAEIWGFGRPVIFTDLKAEHWDNPASPLTHEGVDRCVSVLRSNPDFNNITVSSPGSGDA